VLLLLALQPTHLGLLSALLGLGFVVGLFGHINKSKRTILLGILVVGLISTYFVVFTLVPQN
jgi:hypothetical protein